MPSWIAGAVGTFAISAVSAYLFLLLRCRGIGYPLGPRARWWAFAIVGITAIISTGLGAAAVAVNGHLRAVVVGLVVPSGLWLGRASGQRRRRDSLLPAALVAWLTFPLRHLDDRMGDDLQEWCDVRSAAVSENPQLIPDAAQHYCLQVTSRLKDAEARHELDLWLVSIRHKARTARMIDLETAPDRLQAELRRHPGTRDSRKYSVDDPERLVKRLASEAENELHLILARIYRLGFRKLVIYRGFKPASPPDRTGRPAAPSRAPFGSSPGLSAELRERQDS
jgi:hypothetical protein